MENTHTVNHNSDDIPNAGATMGLTNELMQARDSTGINRILVLTCDADEKRQEALATIEYLIRCVPLLCTVQENIREITSLHGPYIISESPAMMEENKKNSKTAAKEEKESG